MKNKAVKFTEEEILMLKFQINKFTDLFNKNIEDDQKSIEVLNNLKSDIMFGDLNEESLKLVAKVVRFYIDTLDASKKEHKQLIIGSEAIEKKVLKALNYDFTNLMFNYQEETEIENGKAR